MSEEQQQQPHMAQPGEVFEMLWDCEFCETKGLLGKSQRHCPECGGKQNPDKRYFPPPDREVRVDGHKYEGADQLCPSCGAAVGSAAKNCTNCGSPFDGKSVKGVATAEPPKKKFPWLKVLLIVGGIILFIFLIWFFFFRTKTGEVTVTAHRWERVVSIEKFVEVREDCWGHNCAPRGDHVNNVRCSDEDTTEQVKTGEKCDTVNVDNKDGTFRKEKRNCKDTFTTKTVKKERCKYDVRKWTPDGEVKASGGMDKKREWPTTAGLGAADARASLGARREKSRSEHLLLEFKGGDTCDVSEDLWTKIKDGAKLKVTMKVRSEAVQCDSIKAP